MVNRGVVSGNVMRFEMPMNNVATVTIVLIVDFGGVRMFRRQKCAGRQRDGAEEAGQSVPNTVAHERIIGGAGRPSQTAGSTWTCRIRMTRSAKPAKSSGSWLTQIIVMPSCCCSSTSGHGDAISDFVEQGSCVDRCGRTRPI